jgi:hypothetical protein
MKLKTIRSAVSTALIASFVAISLTGCALLYPNWETTANPSDPATTSSSSSPAPSDTESATPSSSPSVAKAKAQINFLDSGVDATAGVIYAVASVSSVVQDGGLCTLTFIGAGKTKTVTGKAEANVTSTQCHPLELSIAGLPKGAGLITMTYDSPTHTGTSTAVGVVIP